MEYDIAIKALEEIQRYRAIGTVGRFQQLTKQFKPHVTDKTSCPHRGCNKCDMYRKENEKYHEIGTVEECREARERQRGKKPLQGEPYTWISSVRIKGRYRDVRKTSYHHICPNCRENVAMDMSCCKYCGQAIDWSDAP